MAQKDSKTLDELCKLENGFWEAAGTDGSYYEKNFANEGRMVLPFAGGILNKEQTIAAVKAASAWSTFTIDNPDILPVSEGAAILTYSTTAQRTGEPEYTAHIASVYRQENSQWKLFMHQQTPFADASAQS